jgi:hypothetical protein
MLLFLLFSPLLLCLFNFPGCSMVRVNDGTSQLNDPKYWLRRHGCARPVL